MAVESVEPVVSADRRRAAKCQLDTLVVGIGLTPTSIIHGLALAVLAGASVEPLLHWQRQAWPNVLTGIAVILISPGRARWCTRSASSAGRSNSGTRSDISSRRCSRPRH